MARYSHNIREQLLKSAKEEFLSQGFERASLRTICRKAGVTTGAFYNHFNRKEDLFDALVAPMLSGFQRMYQQVFDSYAGRAVDPNLVRIILYMKFEEYMELIYGGYSMEEVKKLITRLTLFSEAGFRQLIEEIKKED